MPLCMSSLGGLPGVLAATLCRGIVRRSAKGTTRKDNATNLNPLAARVGEVSCAVTMLPCALPERYVSHET